MTIFISHSSAQKPWVETLAQNLVSAGYQVFLDIWHLVPGRDYPEGLYAGLESASAVVLVISPEALRSGWVRSEINNILARKGPGFLIIPVIYTAVDSEFPFLAARQKVDFQPPVPYRAAFKRLLCGLEGSAPGPDPWYDGQLIEPPAQTTPEVTSPLPWSQGGPRALQSARFRRDDNRTLIARDPCFYHRPALGAATHRR